MVKKTLQKGVTLVELLVVVAIFSVVASVLLFNFSDFSTNVSVRNLAQDIALTVRKAQSYATSVRSVNSTILSNQFPAYGISFEAGNTVNLTDYNADPKQFVLFADVGAPGDEVYNEGGTCTIPSAGDECIESLTITSSDRIVSLCTDVGGCTTTGRVDVVFKRPTPDAEICVVTGGVCSGQPASYVEVNIQSAKGLVKTVSVWNTGQISVR